jgi:hypothetical protein
MGVSRGVSLDPLGDDLQRLARCLPVLCSAQFLASIICVRGWALF